ncbi:hypothetical protein [Streptomyces bacillaris]|uniref:hypothetical protein n=1 Tax=Streptomyces bacillaris TaxID=68179 RepID=UPI00363AA858
MALAVEAELLYEESRRAVLHAARELWQGQEVILGPQRPSITSYVCPVTVSGTQLVAKYDWLGVPLVSVLRGARGDWAAVRDAQPSYVASSDLLAVREEQHHALLQRLGRPRVCEVEAQHGGVLFTRAAPGTPMAEAVVARPGDTAEVLESVLLALRDLHGPKGDWHLREMRQVDHGSIVGAFMRTFRALGAVQYVRSVGESPRLADPERESVVRQFEGAVRRLVRLTAAVSPRSATVVFGNLQPEGVLLSGSRITLLAPALHRAGGPEPDVARLVGRTLLLGLCQPEAYAERQITDGAVAVLRGCLSALSREKRDAWLRQVLVLWLMDLVTLLSACLCAPPGFLLTLPQEQLVGRALRVTAIADRVSGYLTGSKGGLDLLYAVVRELEYSAWAVR